MNEKLPFSIKRAVNRFESIEYNGLTVYPILVKEYENFLIGRPALEVMHQSLPVAMMRVPLLSALYQIDYEARLEGKQPVGLFARALLCMALALRLGEGLDIKERLGLFSVSVDRKDAAKLSRVQFVDSNGEKKEIMPGDFKKLREIIAAQNGVRIEADNANPDIVQAKKDMSSGGVNLDQDIESMVSFAAAMSSCEEADIDEWPILKLTRRLDVYQTMLSYVVCGIGEASGASWKNGNPCPHPIFKKADNWASLASPIQNALNRSKAVKTVDTIEQQIHEQSTL